MINSFRTYFWIEQKKWFVICQSIKSSHRIKLYTIPYQETSFNYNFDQSHLILSTYINKLNHSFIMNYVTCLALNLTEIKSKQMRKYVKFNYFQKIYLQIYLF